MSNPASADPRVAQFSEPEARRRVREAISELPALEATAFSHRPWYRGSPLTAEEALRVGCGRSIRVVGIRYTQSRRVVCDACTYGRHAQAKGEGWAQPIFAGGMGAFDCAVCGGGFTGELEMLPKI